jgi:hypothetical protein
MPESLVGGAAIALETRGAETYWGGLPRAHFIGGRGVGEGGGYRR